MQSHFFSLSIYLGACLGLLFTSCNDQSSESASSYQHPKGEFIYRKHDETTYSIPPPRFQSRDPYVWETDPSNQLPLITKEHFRCNGNILNPPRCIVVKGEKQFLADCGGATKHSLPIRNGKEFIFPVLIELLNHIQQKTQKKVVVTSGHRCPDHNTYVDETIENCSSKHMIGAEVSFYIEGLQEHPDIALDAIQHYYKSHALYSQQKDYTDFKRYEKGNTCTSVLPWYNKEVFIKVFQRNEGRNLDNSHPYPYISIQVRHDRDNNERVVYSWEKATKNYFRK